MKSHLKSRIRNFFLVDAIGAAGSTIFLGIVLPIFSEYLGMPQRILFFLAGLALLLSIYSGRYSIYPPKNFKLFSNAIIIANSLYCFLTFSLVIYFFSDLKTLGLLYFLGEISILLILIRWEFKMAKQIILS